MEPVAGSVAVSKLNHLEYRLAVAMGTWYCALRHVQPSEELVSARQILVDPTPPADRQVSAAAFANRAWLGILVILLVPFLGYGLLFDGLFYTRSNVAPFIPEVVFGALFVGSIVEALVVRLRARLLVWSDERHDGQLARWVLPTPYDFWPGVVAAIVVIPVFFH